MNMKIMTWNMGYLKQGKEKRNQPWIYLDNEISPDVALLQEAVPPKNRYHDPHIVFPVVPTKDKWCSGIVSKAFNLREFDLVEMIELPEEFKYSVVAADVLLENKDKLGDDVTLTVISIYNNIQELRGATGNLHIVMSYLTPLLLNKVGKRVFVIGGDLNTSLQWENNGKRWKGLSQEILFSRIEDFGLVNCTYKFYQRHVQTYRHKQSVIKWQNDYIFVSRELGPHLDMCAVLSNQDIDELTKDRSFVFALATNASQFSPFSTHRHPEIRLSLPKWRGQ